MPVAVFLLLCWLQWVVVYCGCWLFLAFADSHHFLKGGFVGELLLAARTF